MDNINTEYIDSVKLILGISNESEDGLLKILIDDTVNQILSYCRISVMPRQLEGLVPRIAADKYLKCAQDGIKSITEGERRIEYTDSADSLSASYYERLKPFVSRDVSVPSEVRRDTDDESV